MHVSYMHGIVHTYARICSSNPTSIQQQRSTYVDVNPVWAPQMTRTCGQQAWDAPRTCACHAWMAQVFRNISLLWLRGRGSVFDLCVCVCVCVWHACMSWYKSMKTYAQVTQESFSIDMFVVHSACWWAMRLGNCAISSPHVQLFYGTLHVHEQLMRQRLNACIIYDADI